MASIAAHHAEWLSLMDVSGPFLSVPVLKEAMPNGLDAHDPYVAAEVRAALEQWTDPDGTGLGSIDDVEVHLAFVRFVFHEVLGFDNDVLRWDPKTASEFTVEVPHVGVLTPDAVVVDGDDAAMLVSVAGPGVRVDEIDTEAGALTPQERMVEHLKATGLRIGLVTDGERWTLVSYKEGENPGLATWWSSLWGEEKITLQAFRTLLRQDRFVSMGADETIAGLLDRSAEAQREITTKLGNQTLDAVEILIRTIDRIDHERGAQLLAEVPVEELYDAAVTVMMRLIFLFYAEENDLLPVAEPLYNNRYAASTLRERLQAAADEHGEEVLENTHDGWPRLLATWRAVFGGVEHGEMVLAPYGGSLFDPDRFPFLEGRQPGTSWTTDAADPLPIDNRTVLHLLNALQTLEEGGQRRKLSFRALDVEQIGHVYEGMLDHTGARAEGWVLGLSGTGGREPEIELHHLESLDEKALLDFLKEQTGRAPTTLKHSVSDDEAGKAVTKFGITWSAAFAGSDLATRARRFAKLIRPDSTGAPTVFQPGSVYVADSSHRGATGTHYTPRSLTEEVVKHTLDPLIYVGPVDGVPEDEWVLRPPEEILDLKICDPACGSGAFLVQACRYLADAVVEAKRIHQRRSDPITEDEIIAARRQVAERCLHGVDINPMACEMAKLSLWLITLAHDRPFTFLNHAIRRGDSLLGATRLRTLADFTPNPDVVEPAHRSLTGRTIDIEGAVQTASCRLVELRSGPTDSIADIEAKRRAHVELQNSLEQLSVIADMLFVATVQAAPKGIRALQEAIGRAQNEAALAFEDLPSASARVMAAAQQLEAREGRAVVPFHWPIEFPDVFAQRHGFDAFIGNPPFLGNKYWKEQLGPGFQGVAFVLLGAKAGKIDLSVLFLRRCFDLLDDHGTFGLLTSVQAADGEATRVGFGKIAEAGCIYRADKGIEWPGSAQVRINKVWGSRKPIGSTALLNGQVVSSIGGSLNEDAKLSDPTPLEPPDFWCFVGVDNSKGTAFVLKPGDSWLEQLQDSPFLRAYVSGEDLGARPPGYFKRWVIDCGDASLETVRREHALTYEFLDKVVRPTRQPADLSSYKGLADRWWQFWNTRGPQFERLREHPGCIVVPKVALFVLPVRADTNICFTNQVVALEEVRGDELAVCRSSAFVEWITRHSTPFGVGGGIRPSLTKGFFTFVAPPRSDTLVELSQRWNQLAGSWCVERGVGQTKLQHAANNPDADADDIRALLSEIDTHVLAAYGWQDIDLEIGFHPCGAELRFGPSRGALEELMVRLRQLNTERSK